MAPHGRIGRLKPLDTVPVSDLTPSTSIRYFAASTPAKAKREGRYKARVPTPGDRRARSSGSSRKASDQATVSPSVLAVAAPSAVLDGLAKNHGCL
jgi:hypothetical protein